MATSGVSNFGVTTEIIDLFTEAYERCGRTSDSLSANDLDSARRSLSFMFTEWANTGPNLWAVDQQRFTLYSGVASVNLPTNTVSILQAVVSYDDGTTITDTSITAISRAEYANIPVKAQTGTSPTQFYLERTLTPIVHLWPVPDNSSRVFIYWRMRMLQDPGALSNTMDAPNRWMDAIASGLAARLAEKWAPDRLDRLTAKAASAYVIAAQEDTESVPIRIYPDFDRADY